MTRSAQYLFVATLITGSFVPSLKNIPFVLEYSIRIPYYYFVEGLRFDFDPFTNNAIPFYLLAAASIAMVFGVRSTLKLFAKRTSSF